LFKQIPAFLIKYLCEFQYTHIHTYPRSDWCGEEEGKEAKGQDRKARGRTKQHRRVGEMCGKRRLKINV